MIHAGHLHKVVNLYGSNQAMLRSTEPFPILREIGMQYKRDNKVGQSGSEKTLNFCLLFPPTFKPSYKLKTVSFKQ